jgi:hypothetical protein
MLDFLQIIYPEMSKEEIMILCIKTRWEIDANKLKDTLMAIMPKSN